MLHFTNIGPWDLYWQVLRLPTLRQASAQDKPGTPYLIIFLIHQLNVTVYRHDKATDYTSKLKFCL
jgi:hypothetical protein